MKRVLIVGASSFIGSNIALRLRDQNEVIGTFYSNKIRLDKVTPLYLPLVDPEVVGDWIKILAPDVCIYCSAIVDETAILKDPLGSLRINAEIPALISDLMKQLGGRFIFLSTAKVFAGDSDGNYNELSETNPQGQYGLMKRRAEESFEMTTGSFTFRLGTVFGVGALSQETSLVNRLLRKFLNSEPQPFISDEYRTFFPATGVAQAVETVIEAPLAMSGVYHLSNNEKQTYYDFAKALRDGFSLYHSKITPISGSLFQGKLAESGGARGKDLSLDGSLFCKNFQVQWPTFSESIDNLLSPLRGGALISTRSEPALAFGRAK